MGQMIVIKQGGTAVVQSKDKTTLEEVQKLVGGYIEAVPMFDKWNGEKAQAWCDEEGKLKEYQYNKHATRLWNEILEKHHDIKFNTDHLVGDIVILTGSAMLD